MNNPFDPAHIQEEKAEREARRLRLRTNLLIAVFCSVLAAFFAVLYEVQVVKGADYRSSTNSNFTQTERVDSIRGDVLDRYGRMLVTNELSYNVELDWDAMGTDRLQILGQLLDVCREEEVVWTSGLPISAEAPWSYTTETPFSYQTKNQEGELVTVKTSLGRLAEADSCKWVENAEKASLTAGELLTKMCRTFGLLQEGEAPSQRDRELAGVLYELYLRRCEVNNNPYVFARGVGIAFISKVKERALDGVRIETAAARKYETRYAAHVLGWTGLIPSESAEHYRELGYPSNATVGRDGVELAFEEQLHGASGIRLIEMDEDGNTVSQEWRKVPEPGDNAVLTVDITLQAATEDLLAQYAATQEESGGMAAAVVDMTGGVLALASYPTYDLADMDYMALMNDTENRPLVNRATQGLYAPGSTFKMLTAVAALSEGAITPTQRVECTGYYTHWADVDFTPHCWIYDSVPGARHGWENVTKAITDSCNIFFYEAGRLTGIEKLGEYAAKFGLGEYTGIELPEYKGDVAGPETSEKYHQTWQGGAITSAAIGQENNQFTPLQLANYVATLVNGGNHYQCHLLKEFKSSDYSQVTQTYEPNLLDTVDLDETSLRAVLKGMQDLAETPGMARYFSSLPVKVGCKTGTAQVAAKTANAVFVCYAPYDDPQVALCLVAEQGASGGNLAELAAGILAQYFSTDSSLSSVAGENTLLR